MKEKKQVFPSRTRMKNSIKKVFDSISETFFNENKDWYWDCHKWCKSLAEEKDIDLMCVAGCFSSLSPQVSYAQNKVYCRLFFDGIRKQTNTQHNKALDIIRLFGIDIYEERKETILSILSGSKTQNFFLNILEPWNKEACTIDRHALVIAGVTRPTVTPLQYEAIKKAYIDVAEELDILPAELQAATWCYYREQKFGHNLYG